jgi:hypothetical protein
MQGVQVMTSVTGCPCAVGGVFVLVVQCFCDICSLAVGPQIALAIAFHIIDTASPALQSVLYASPLASLCSCVVTVLLQTWEKEARQSNVVSMMAIGAVALQIGRTCLNKHVRSSGAHFLSLPRFSPAAHHRMSAANMAKAFQFKTVLLAAYQTFFNDITVLHSQVARHARIQFFTPSHAECECNIAAF